MKLKILYFLIWVLLCSAVIWVPKVWGTYRAYEADRDLLKQPLERGFYLNQAPSSYEELIDSLPGVDLKRNPKGVWSAAVYMTSEDGYQGAVFRSVGQSPDAALVRLYQTSRGFPKKGWTFGYFRMP